MKNHHFKPKFHIHPLIVLVFFLFPIANIPAQTFNLKEYVIGNSYDPGNRGFTWEASKYCPYNWSIKTKRIDYLGGEIELHASPGTKPECKSIYNISWTFSKDMRTVSCGEKVFVDIRNIPISKMDCGIFVWEGSNNPSSITIFTGSGVGESGLVYETRSKDPQGSYRDYVFQHYPGQVVQGEPQSVKLENTHIYNGRLELVVCPRKDFAKIANGSSFAFRIGNRGISFDVVYLYSKDATIISGPTSSSLQNPIIQHNLQNAEGAYWMSIQVPGFLQGYAGKQIYLVIRFVDANGNLLPGNQTDARYVDANGYAATATIN